MIEETRVVDSSGVAHSHMHAHSPISLYKKLSWTAVFVGALVGLGLTFLLNLFGLSIGLSMFNVNNDGVMALAVGGLIGVLIGTIVAMLVAGFAAGYLGRPYCEGHNLGLLYGFTTWTIMLLMSALATAHMGNYVTAYTNKLTNSVIVASVAEGNTNDIDVVTTNDNPTGKAVKINTTPGTIAWSAFLVFVLFFAGAVSSCIGAYWAMNGCCRHRE